MAGKRKKNSHESLKPLMRKTNEELGYGDLRFYKRSKVGFRKGTAHIHPCMVCGEPVKRSRICEKCRI